MCSLWHHMESCEPTLDKVEAIPPVATTLPPTTPSLPSYPRQPNCAWESVLPLNRRLVCIQGPASLAPVPTGFPNRLFNTEGPHFPPTHGEPVSAPLLPVL